MCIETSAIYKMQMIEDKMVKLIPLSEEDKTFLLRNNMHERIEMHKTYLDAMQKMKDTEQYYRKVYGDDIIDKLMRGMPLS